MRAYMSYKALKMKSRGVVSRYKFHPQLWAAEQQKPPLNLTRNAYCVQKADFLGSCPR